MPETMIEWAAVAAKLARQAADPPIKQSRIAAELDVDQSTIARFESGKWPADPDRMLAAYAQVCGIEGGALAFWATAAELWARHRHQIDGEALPDLDEFEREIGAVSRRLAKAGRSSAAAPPER